MKAHFLLPVLVIGMLSMQSAHALTRTFTGAIADNKTNVNKIDLTGADLASSSSDPSGSFAKSFASLAQGQLKAYATSQSAGSFRGQTANAQAQMVDTIKFGGAEAGTTAFLTVHFHGSLSGVPYGPFPSAQVNLDATIGSPTNIEYGSLHRSLSNYFNGCVGTCGDTGIFVGDLIDQTYRIPFLFTSNPDDLYQFAVTLNARTEPNPNGSTTIADFFNTATLGIEAPTGVTFTSESGLFLTRPVPEPETWAMVGLGLVMLSWVARSRHGHTLKSCPA